MTVGAPYVAFKQIMIVMTIDSFIPKLENRLITGCSKRGARKRKV